MGIYFKGVRRSQAILFIFLGILIIEAAQTLDPFADMAEAWGLSRPVTFGTSTATRLLVETTGAGLAILDFDGDGRQDLLLLSGIRSADSQPQPPLLYRNLGAGRFKEVASETGLTAQGWAQGVCHGDIDNDGDPDLVLTHYGVTRLYRNDEGHFTDATAAWGLPTSGHSWGAGCALLDYDRDGRLDLFLSRYVNLTPEATPAPGSRPECLWKDMPVACGPRGLPTATNSLYHQTPGAKFVDVSAAAGILKPGGRYGLGVAVADFNNDGWPDIYVACDQTPSLLYQNTGKGTFTERAVEAGVAFDNNGRAQAGMGVAVADFDGNGTLDIAKTNFSGDLPSLYLNEDAQFFHDTADSAGLGKHLLLGWGIAFYDHDEDGQPDLILANGHVYPEVDRAQLGESYRQPTLVYRNLGNGKFADLSSLLGAAISAPKASRGLALGDLNGDHRPEIVLSNLNAAPTVLRRSGPRRNLLKLTLQGTRSNRSAFGARVTVTAGALRQVQELSSGGSYFSQHETALYFGLGPATKADTIEIRWPNGLRETWRHLDAARPHHLIEGAASR